MANRKITARHVELYGSAYRLAWKHIFSRPKHKQPNIALRLHASVLRQIDEGATDSLSIALEALCDVEKSEPGTQISASKELSQRN
jgi:hypothetical protein